MKKASTLSKFKWKRGDKIQLLIWDENIEKAFVVLLILTVIVLSILAYLQHRIIVG